MTVGAIVSVHRFEVRRKGEDAVVTVFDVAMVDPKLAEQVAMLFALDQCRLTREEVELTRTVAVDAMATARLSDSRHQRQNDKRQRERLLDKVDEMPPHQQAAFAAAYQRRQYPGRAVVIVRSSLESPPLPNVPVRRGAGKAACATLSAG